MVSTRHTLGAVAGAATAIVLTILDRQGIAALALVIGVGVGVVSIDAAERRIPTHLVSLGAGALAACSLVDLILQRDLGRIAAGAVSAVVIGLVFVAIYLWRPAALGFGDVRLATLIATVVSWGTTEVATAIVAVLFATVGATIAMALLRRPSLPFAPFLIPSAVAAVVLSAAL